jgi:hypothetical protein
MACLKHSRSHGKEFGHVVVTIPCGSKNVNVYLYYHVARYDRKRINSPEVRALIERKSREGLLAG